jgi:hypothetical protein
LWLQVTSIDKRIDFPRIHLDHHQLPSEFLRKASYFPISFMRLSVHCQSPELQQPARAGKVGASGPQAQRHGDGFNRSVSEIAADAVENLRVRSCVLDDGCSG